MLSCTSSVSKATTPATSPATKAFGQMFRRFGSEVTIVQNAVPRAIETGETRGFMKAVVDADSGQILGCAVLGSEGGEIMSMLQVAMLGGLSYTAMANAIFTHPLLAEGLNALFEMFDANVSGDAEPAA